MQNAGFRRHGLHEQLKTAHHGSQMALVVLAERRRDALRLATRRHEAQLAALEAERRAQRLAGQGAA